MSELQSQGDKLPPPSVGNSCQEEFTSGDQWNWRGTGARTGVSGASIEAGGSQRGMPCQDCQAHDR